MAGIFAAAMKNLQKLDKDSALTGISSGAGVIDTWEVGGCTPCFSTHRRNYFEQSQYRSVVNLGWEWVLSPARVRIKKRSYSVCAIGGITGAPSARRIPGSLASCQTTSTLAALPERIASINSSGLVNGIATGFRCNFSARGAAVCCVR